MDLIKSEYESKNEQKLCYLNDLEEIVRNSKSKRCVLEGNCFYHHSSFREFPELYSKQVNLFWCGKQAVKNMCEIGFNAGHSSMLLLLGRSETPLNFTIFDIGHHTYTKPACEYMKSKFPFVNFEYIEGDSTITMPEWIDNHQELKHTYDVIHVDGGHNKHCITNDMKNSDFLLKKDGIMIVDDTDNDYIDDNVNLYISNGNYEEVELLPTQGYPHRVIKKIK